MSATATADSGGFAKLPNALVERGILAHIRPQALKVFLAILHAWKRHSGSNQVSAASG